MLLTLGSISTRVRKAKSAQAQSIAVNYIERASTMSPVETLVFDSEAALFASTERQPGRTGARPAAQLILFDSRGDLLTSTEFSALIARLRDDGSQRILFAIGPADGWSPTALARADKVLSLGRMTLPHELARAVVAEQIYRALTILAGHPYHSGH